MSDQDYCRVINEHEYDRGYEDGIAEYKHGEYAGNPVGESDDYILGFWCGIGDTQAFYDGYEAACNGVISCPYMIDADDECFREPWLLGFWEKVSHDHP